MSRRMGFLISTIFMISILAGVGLYYQQTKAGEKTQTDYVTTMDYLVSKMIDSGSKAETMRNEYKDVWYKAIHEDYGFRLHDGYVSSGDFNKALTLQIDYFEKNGDMNQIQADRIMVDEYMKKLANPPQEFKDAYEAVVSLYTAYHEFEELAEHPSGSYQSFSTKTDGLSAEMVRKLNEYKVRNPKSKI